MKKFALIIPVFFAMGFLSAQTDIDAPAVPVQEAPKTPAISFSTTSHDFGNVIEGEMATYTFEFTNTGTDTIRLTNVRASCGCTTPQWDKQAIAPGAKGTVVAQYNSRGRVGSFNKNISVYSTGGDVVLYIKGVVLAEPEKPKSPIIIGQ